MSKTFMTKRKAFTAILAVVMAVTIIFGGTFAWQSIQQEALNEVSATVNPGGRLHDDFNGSNKDVYVENFAENEIFARIRLDEYFSVTMNKGTNGEIFNEIAGTMDTETGEITEWVTHYFDSYNATDDYWDWQTGGSTVFMPTFNKNKDSLVADINGTYEGVDGVVTNEATDDRYTDYVEYTYGETKTDDAVYDIDSNMDEDDGVEYVSEEHTAKNTLGATLMSMQEWIDAGSQPGDYWVYDTDGWVYWADPIAPGEATGLLLDGISLKDKMDDSWYYAINVIAQFVTADDLGSAEDNDGLGSGFYKNGETVSPEALELLTKIGVDVNSEQIEEDPTYEYMWVYLTEVDDETHEAYYIKPESAYLIHFEIDPSYITNSNYACENLLNVTPELSLELTELNGSSRKLKAGTDYTVESIPEFENTTDANDNLIYSVSATISFAESTVIPYASTINVTGFADETFSGSGNYVVSDVRLPDENIDILLYDAETNEEVTENAVEENKTYDIVVKIRNDEEAEYVIYSSDTTIAEKSNNIETVSLSVYSHRDDDDSFEINETGQLVVGIDTDPNKDWEIYNHNIYIDDLTISVSGEDVIVTSEDGSKTHYYVYKERDAFFKDEKPLYVYVDNLSSLSNVTASANNRSFWVFLTDIDYTEITSLDNYRVTIEGALDSTTNVETSSEDGRHYLNLGANESAERLVIVVSNSETGEKGAVVVDITYE